MSWKWCSQKVAVVVIDIVELVFVVVKIARKRMHRFAR